ncbi:MAG TPA: Asp23/Gls24 family envelope stress response protein [Actinophytocola sp.]|nr:Asp23/Gls24 family envelope stress response protein [Actinophytocola sp.]
MTTTLEPTAPADERGLTTVAEHTVARIAEQALTEVPDVGGAARRVLGVSLGGEDLSRDADVTARVHGATVALGVRLSIVYPASVRRVTERAREHLSRRVLELTGLRVSTVDIKVAALHTVRANTRRVE